MVAIGKYPASRTYRERKRQAALIAVASRVHARLHHALAYMIRIPELR
jgi:hypothetical protein